jgi:hypothetical protein
MKTSISISLIRNLVALVGAACLVAACGPSEEEIKAQADAEAATRAATKARIAKQQAAADPLHNMAHAVAIGKTQPVFDLKYDITKKPIVGEPIEIELAFVPMFPGDSFHATISPASHGLTLEGNLTPSTSEVKAGEPWRIKLIAHAAAPLAYYFNIAADHNASGVRSTRNFAIPLFASAVASATPSATPGATAPAAK